MIRISDDPQRFAPGARLIHEDGRELVVASGRSHRDRFLVRFEGVSDRITAQDLRGALYVPLSEARELGTDEYWIHDLVGCRVLDPAGRDIGVVASVIPNPAQDLLAVDTPEGERLIPAVRQILMAVDLTERRVTVDLPEGLLET